MWIKCVTKREVYQYRYSVSLNYDGESVDVVFEPVKGMLYSHLFTCFVLCLCRVFNIK